MCNVEQAIASMRDETIREIGKDTISAAAKLAWYWSYIGALDMAQELGLIDNSRRYALYREAEKFKPVCEVRAVQSKSSVLDSLRQCREDAGKSQGGTAAPKHDPER